MIQTTFTKQKRELAKAAGLMEKLRAQEVRKVTYDANNVKLTEERVVYVDFGPEEIAEKVLSIVVDVVGQHGARQRANSRNTGRFDWCGVTADLTVPQLRALQDAHSVLNELVQKLPRRNSHTVPNTTVDGRPAFQHPAEKQFARRTRYKPYEEDSTTRVRTYEEYYEELEKSTQTVEIDFGLEPGAIESLRELVVDLGTSIQVAIDEANTKGTETDPVLNGVIEGIRGVFQSKIPAPPKRT